MNARVCVCVCVCVSARVCVGGQGGQPGDLPSSDITNIFKN